MCSTTVRRSPACVSASIRPSIKLRFRPEVEASSHEAPSGKSPARAKVESEGQVQLEVGPEGRTGGAIDGTKSTREAGPQGQVGGRSSPATHREAMTIP